MSKVAIFRRDAYGFPRFAHPDWMTPPDARALRDAEHPGCELLTYGQYKAQMDPDDMSEAENRRRFGSGAPAPDARRIAITGRIAGFPTRAEAVAHAEAQGWRVADRVTEHTALLWAGQGGGRKRADAARHGVPVVEQLPGQAPAPVPAPVPAPEIIPPAAPVPVHTALLLDRGNPALILGHAAKRRRGALLNLLRANADRIRPHFPDLIAENTPMKTAGARLIFGHVTLCWAGDEPEIPSHPIHIDGVETRRDRWHLRRKHDLTEIAVEVPRARIDEAVAAVHAITAAHIAEATSLR